MRYVIAAGVFLALFYFLKVLLRISRMEMDVARLGSRIKSLKDSVQGIQEETTRSLESMVQDLGEAAHPPGTETGYESISAESAAKILEENTQAFFLDVRSVSEYAPRHIPGAKLISVEELPSRLHELPRDRQPLVVVCERGPRSAAACAILLQAGFQQVMRVEGGMSAWTGRVEAGV